jgi:hypothetical protein
VRWFLKNLWSSKKPGWRILRMSTLIIVGLVAIVTLFEDKYIYYPAKYPQGDWNLTVRFAR